MMPDSSKPKLIVALDLPTAAESIGMFTTLRGAASCFKIGSQLFTAAGPSIVREIVSAGAEVFLDLKFYDIPNTVASAAREATRLGVSIFNVHASGGAEMMRRTAEAVAETAARENLSRPRVIAVTVLTSHDQNTLAEIGVAPETMLDDQVLRLAELSKRSKMDGVVASVHEAARIRAAFGEDFLIVTPGVRPAQASVHDQRRVSTPTDAARAGVDYIVVGRAVLESSDPARAVRDITQELLRAAESSTPASQTSNARSLA